MKDTKSAPYAEAGKREARRRRLRRHRQLLAVGCVLLAAVPLLIYGIWKTSERLGSPASDNSRGPDAIVIPELSLIHI